MTDTKHPKGSSWCSSVSLCLLAWSSMALFFFLVSWAVGGDEFAESIGGYDTLFVLLWGIALGVLLKIIPWHRGNISPQH
jgi:hypothetical protein